MSNVTLSAIHSAPSSPPTTPRRFKMAARAQARRAAPAAAAAMAVDYSTMPGKPPHSYAELVYLALDSLGGQGALPDIYDYITRNFMYYRLNDGAWKNSVRHNLCQSSWVRRLARDTAAARSGKGCVYALEPRVAKKLYEDGALRRRTRRESRAEAAQSLDAALAGPDSMLEDMTWGAVLSRVTEGAMIYLDDDDEPEVDVLFTDGSEGSPYVDLPSSPLSVFDHHQPLLQPLHQHPWAPAAGDQLAGPPVGPAAGPHALMMSFNPTVSSCFPSLQCSFSGIPMAGSFPADPAFCIDDIDDIADLHDSHAPIPADWAVATEAAFQ